MSLDLFMGLGFKNSKNVYRPFHGLILMLCWASFGFDVSIQPNPLPFASKNYLNIIWTLKIYFQIYFQCKHKVRLVTSPAFKRLRIL